MSLSIFLSKEELRICKDLMHNFCLGLGWQHSQFTGPTRRAWGFAWGFRAIHQPLPRQEQWANQ